MVSENFRPCKLKTTIHKEIIIKIIKFIVICVMFLFYCTFRSHSSDMKCSIKNQFNKKKKTISLQIAIKNYSIIKLWSFVWHTNMNVFFVLIFITLFNLFKVYKMAVRIIVFDWFFLRKKCRKTTTIK